jgi:hypothetical protein
VDLSWVTAIDKEKRQLAVKQFAEKSVRVPVTSY